VNAEIKEYRNEEQEVQKAGDVSVVIANQSISSIPMQEE